MCGIAGLLSSRGDVARYIGHMNALQRHRGPDDEGFLLRGPQGIRAWRPNQVDSRANPEPEAHPGSWLALGHRRLSILDLSPLGHQPMCYRDRYWIVYNGEVYNYVELRAELQAAGHQFRSQSDTEVILAAYAEWGTGCFGHLNGMWAMAIYDARENLLVLSRDRFGVKPLHFWSGPGFFAFGSEIKSFTCLPEWRPRVNGQVVHDFLVSGLQDHSAETLFAEVRQLEPGHFARLDCTPWVGAGGAPAPQLQTAAWYRLKPRDFNGTLGEAAARFRELLVDSVRLRLRSDVPVGSCLSGGLDSSSIVCVTHGLLAQQQGRSAHKTFSACSENPRFDERPFIEQVIRSTGAESHLVFPTSADLFNELDRVVWHQDEPFAGTSIFAQWCVFKSAAAAGIKVMLDGQGADEQLCGYNDFRRAFYCGLVRSGCVRLAWSETLAARGSWHRAFGALSRAGLDAVTPGAVQSFFRELGAQQRAPGWLGSAGLKAARPSPLVARFRRHRSARQLSLELLAGAHLQMLLHWEDRNSMAHSVESRVPFLDYRLVEFVTGLPDHYKIRSGITKAVLREGMSGLVPAGILQRRDKMGFVTPEEVWARESGGAIFRERLQEAVTSSRGILDTDAARKLEPCLSGEAPYDSAVWRLIAFGAWMRRFNVAA